MTNTFDLGVDGILDFPPPHETALAVAIGSRHRGDQQRMLALADRDIYAETVIATGITP